MTRPSTHRATPDTFPPAGHRALPDGHHWTITRTRLHVVIEIWKHRRHKPAKRVGIAVCTPQQYANAATDRLTYTSLAWHDAFNPDTPETGEYR